MTARSRLAPAVAVLALSAALLAGCGGDDDPEAGPTSSAGSTSAEETTAPPSRDGEGETEGDGEDDAPPFTANTEPDTQEASPGALLNVTDIRIGGHEGFDRVVFELGGTGTPGWDIRYVDAASSQGSGEAVEVDGEAVLNVVITGVGYPDDTGVEEYSGPRRRSVADTETVTEVVFDATFEGQTSSFIGTTAEVPFRAYLLEDPVRIVVEVAAEE